MLQRTMKEGKTLTTLVDQTSIDRARRVTTDETLPPIPSRPQGEAREEQLDMALEYMDVTQYDFLARKRASIARKKYLSGLTPELLRNKYAGDPRMEYRRSHKPLPELRQARKKAAAMDRFDGWDWDKPLAVHLRPRLPNEADKAEPLLRLLQRGSESSVFTREMREIKRAPRNARRVESPQRISYEYSVKYGLQELFE
ncbi:hypothetical protein Btru_047703 [Bulinus truncatus]|nr:hypothetical protein Btru_047703 [Bulinus truncatus]